MPEWKRPSIELAAVYELHERFKVENEVTADHVLFNFSKETVPLMVINSVDEPVMIHRKTTLGPSQLAAQDKIQNLGTLKSPKSPKLTDRNDAKYDLNLVKNSIDTGIPPEKEQGSLN